MHQFWTIYALVLVILVSNILCDTDSNVHYQKCQDYRAEDETLDENANEAFVKVKVLGNSREGTLISPDTILVINDVPIHEVTVHSFKVYLNDGDNNFFSPENIFTMDHFIVLKMSELIMKQYPRRRACLQIEFPKNSELYVIDNLTLMAIGICVKRDNLSNNICNFNHIFPHRPTPNNSLVLYIKQSETVVVGNYFEYDDESAKVKLIGEENIKWIESVTWNNTIRVQECGQVKLPLTPFIARGMPTRPGEFPWHVAIFNNDRYMCGGTIINTRAIVTSAKGTTFRGGSPVEWLIAVVGLHNRSNPDDKSQILHIQSVIVHEAYVDHYGDNNIAVLRTVESIEYTNFVQPVCIQGTLPQNTIGVVPGWGLDEMDNFATILQKGTFPVHSLRACHQFNDFLLVGKMAEEHFCAGYRNGTNVCHGDDGGGLVTLEGERWILLGIMSYAPGTKQSRCGMSALFTNATSFYNWISDKSG